MLHKGCVLKVYSGWYTGKLTIEIVEVVDCSKSEHSQNFSRQFQEVSDIVKPQNIVPHKINPFSRKIKGNEEETSSWNFSVVDEK